MNSKDRRRGPLDPTVMRKTIRGRGLLNN